MSWEPDDKTIKHLAFVLFETADDPEACIASLRNEYKVWQAKNPDKRMPVLEQYLDTCEQVAKFKREQEERLAFEEEFDEIIDTSYDVEEQEFLYTMYGVEEA